MNNGLIYLDYNSTTPCDPRIIKAMEPYLYNYFYNPSSSHCGGDIAKEAIEKARVQVASIIKADPENIFFTHSATEANNLVIKSFLDNKLIDTIGHPNVISTNSEHLSILKCFLDSYDQPIKIEKDGSINLEKLDNLIKNMNHKPKIISIIFANNIIGNIHDIKKIGKICKKYNILLHTDATQAVGNIPIDVDEMNIWALTFSAHKIYGPKACGVLFVRDVNKIKPLISGGYQEIITSGTMPTNLIVGLGKACEIMQKEGENKYKEIGVLRDLLWKKISSGISDVFVNGTMKNRLTNNLNITIKGVDAEVLVKGMDDVMVSAGSACASGSLDPSHVITALGSPYPECAIRISLGRFTTKQEIEYAANRIIEIVSSIRE